MAPGDLELRAYRAGHTYVLEVRRYDVAGNAVLERRLDLHQVTHAIGDELPSYFRKLEVEPSCDAGAEYH